MHECHPNKPMIFWFTDNQLRIRASEELKRVDPHKRWGKSKRQYFYYRTLSMLFYRRMKMVQAGKMGMRLHDRQ